MYVAVTIVALCLMGFLCRASVNIASGVYLKAKCKGDPAGKVVALTFDDGPHPEITYEVLEVLKKHGVQAAFFVKGELAEKNPELIRTMAAQGHLIGNHTYSHSGRFPLYDTKKMTGELDLCNRAIEKATGQPPIYFRPPFGVTNPTIGKVVRKMKLQTLGWSIRSFDTLRRPRFKVLKRVLGKLHNGAVILLHDDRDGCPELTDRLLSEIKERGYTVKRADEI